MILLHILLPAHYVLSEVWKYWFLIYGIIVVETFTIMIMLKYSLQKSFLASLIGNLLSGFIGTLVMTWIMFLWHLLADNIVPNGKFDIINWVATFILMCLGSVYFETLMIKIIFKDTIKRLFIPLLIGNLLIYVFTAYSMATK